MEYTDLEAVQTIIEQGAPQRVYLKDNGRPTDLADVIYRMMILKESTYSKSVVGGTETEQCRRSRARSIEDVYLVMRSYKNTVTYPLIFEAVEKCYRYVYGRNNGAVIEKGVIKINNPKGVLVCSYCSTVNRRVHGPINLQTTVQEVRDLLGELNLKINAKKKGDKPATGGQVPKVLKSVTGRIKKD